MPGVVYTLAASVGQQVQSGDVLLTLEAMKMESAVTAPLAGKVARLPVSVSSVVDAKDLLAVIEA